MTRAYRKTTAALVAVLLASASYGCSHGRPASGDPRTSLKEDDTEVSYLVANGKRYADQGDLTRAEQYFVLARDAGGDPRTITPLLLRVCVAAKKYRVAIEYGERALRTHPGDSRLRFLVGTLYAAIGEVPAAREHLERVSEELAREPEVQFAVAVFFRDQLQDHAGADARFRHYLAISPSGDHAEEARASLLESVP